MAFTRSGQAAPRLTGCCLGSVLSTDLSVLESYETSEDNQFLGWQGGGVGEGSEVSL